jgi:hypothetical protein
MSATTARCVDGAAFGAALLGRPNASRRRTVGRNFKQEADADALIRYPTGTIRNSMPFVNCLMTYSCTLVRRVNPGPNHGKPKRESGKRGRGNHRTESKRREVLAVHAWRAYGGQAKYSKYAKGIF